MWYYSSLCSNFTTGKCLSLFYRFPSCSDSAENGSDPITNLLTGSALAVGVHFVFNCV